MPFAKPISRGARSGGDILGIPTVSFGCGFPPIASALIAASIAILIMAVTQYLIFKKGRTDFLTPKLEELYLLLNEVSEHNAIQFNLNFRALGGDPAAKSQLSGMDDLDLYGLRRAKKIVMHVRLYFPKLSRAHQLVFAAERELNEIKHNILSGATPDPEEVMLASGQVGHSLMLMEQEIIRNRDLLLGANILPKFYRSTSAAEVANVRPPPPGDPFGPSPARKATNAQTTERTAAATSAMDVARRRKV